MSLDARAIRIKETVIATVNAFPSDLHVHAKTLLEIGWQERFEGIKQLSPFKPSSDNIKDHFMKVALFNLIKDKEPVEWSEDTKRKLDLEYIKLHAKAGNTDDMLRLEPAWALAVGLIFEAAFYLTKYNASPNAGPIVQYLPIINFLLLAGVVTMLVKGFPEGHPPICFSAMARNFLMPASRLDQDPRLLDALKLEIEKLAVVNSVPQPK